jgi:uncharacterized membrane protein YfcA
MSFFHFLPTLPPVLALTFAILGVLLLGISKSGFGGSVGILAIPLFALAFGAQRGTALLLPLLIAADAFSLLHHWNKWHTPTLKLLIPGTLVGIAIGSLILYILISPPTRPAVPATAAARAPSTLELAAVEAGESATHSPLPDGTARQVSAQALNFLTGIICVLYVCLDLVRLRLAAQWHFKPDAKTGFAAGSAIGVISTLAHAAGPVAAIFLLHQGLPRATFLGTIVLYFFAINTTKLIPYSLLPGLIDTTSLLVGAAFLPLVPVGTWLGKTISARLSESLFRNTILAFTFITGLHLVYDALKS